MKGIIMAGGSGTRLYPITIAVSKQLLPVYDKPMVFYPMSMLMLAGIKDILLITTPNEQSRFKEMFGDGSEMGLNISYVSQPSPDGLAQAFILGKDFIGDDSVCFILGDNIFYGSGLRQRLINARLDAEKGVATIFGYFVNDPERFGIAEFDEKLNVISVEEKPINPKSNYAITGLYFFDNKAVKYAQSLKPSKRGELEIIGVIDQYLKAKKLKIDLLGRGFTWLDTGTHDSLADASDFVKMIEQRQGVQIGCLEEISYINGWLSKEKLLARASKMGNSPYGKHLKNVADGKIVY